MIKNLQVYNRKQPRLVEELQFSVIAKGRQFFNGSKCSDGPRYLIRYLNISFLYKERLQTETVTRRISHWMPLYENNQPECSKKKYEKIGLIYYGEQL